MAFIAAAVPASVLASDPVGYQLIEALGRLLISVLVVAPLWRFGNLKAAGISQVGTAQVWLLVLLFLVFGTLIHFLAFFGGLSLSFPNPILAISVALDGSAAGILEELAFRGVLLFVAARVWADSDRGLWKATMVSSVYFGAGHLLHIGLGEPTAVVCLLSVDAALAGIYYAGFVFFSRSIWPAVALHAGLNGLVGAVAVGRPGFEETVSAWVWILISKLPLVLVGVFLLKRASRSTRTR
jgi:membrane protease YdiL (CAAX protease family)